MNIPSRRFPTVISNRWGWAVWGVVTGMAGLAAATTELRNDAIQLGVESRGAIISDLRLPREEASWLSAGKVEDTNELFGHFLCFDRWGPVTSEEAASGIPYHGEAARLPWALMAPEALLGVAMTTTLPVTGLRVDRSVHLPTRGGNFQISTTVSNPTAELRPYNLVEHITLADSWNDPGVRLHTNAETGLVHSRGKLVAEASVRWPILEWGDESWDLRGAVTRRGRLVASLVFPDDAEWGWVCLQHPSSGRLLAYVWRTGDFPWLNLFWSADGSQVKQRAIEPGTTGLHRPIPELLTSPAQLGRPVIGRLAPAADRTFALWGVAAKLPDAGIEIVALERTKAGWIARDAEGHKIKLSPPF